MFGVTFAFQSVESGMKERLGAQRCVSDQRPAVVLLERVLQAGALHFQNLQSMCNLLTFGHAAEHRHPGGSLVGQWA